MVAFPTPQKLRFCGDPGGARQIAQQFVCGQKASFIPHSLFLIPNLILNFPKASAPFLPEKLTKEKDCRII